jgi:hypothetical protein
MSQQNHPDHGVIFKKYSEKQISLTPLPLAPLHCIAYKSSPPKIDKLYHLLYTYSCYGSANPARTTQLQVAS